ncbi:helix-turn-helix domain-containing protein [Streptomyces sp. NPDC020681]|uniref:helix-turn-helix domain-containing protein n=1 Tax=Streptomyces sp. NPDC020681 TaxID=3365083 RepID=UPI0037A3E350
MTKSTTPSAIPLPSAKERRRLRESKAMSEQEVAEAVGVTKTTVRSWETGRSNPRGRKRAAYARLLAALEDAPDIARKQEQDTAQEQKKAQEPMQAKSSITKPEPAPEPKSPQAESSPVKCVQTLAQTRRAKQAHSTTRPMAAAKRAAKPPTVPANPAPPQPHRPARAEPEAEAQAETRAPSKAQTPMAANRDNLGPPEPPEPHEPHEPQGEPVPTSPEPVGLTPAEAFDALYAYAAAALVRQTFLLTGRRRLARESVERAFHLAWEHWPEVARDRDPVGWVRAAAYEFAMSPWKRLRRAHRRPDTAPVDGERRALLDALLELPPSYRRTLLLYDGIGLDLPETAAETEATTPAAANRVLHAREAIAERLPELSTPEALHEQLAALARDAPVPELAPAREVRTRGERRARLWTRSALTIATVIMGATAFTLVNAPTRYEPPLPVGRQVVGVPPPLSGPQALTKHAEQLRKKLLDNPAHGPERLRPQNR